MLTVKKVNVRDVVNILEKFRMNSFVSNVANSSENWKKWVKKKNLRKFRRKFRSHKFNSFFFSF